MPELPEVENARALVERNCCMKKIVRVIAQNDDKVFKGSNPEDLRKAMENRVILEAKRKGKYLWFRLDNDDGISPLFHFGMTGSFVVENVDAARYIRLKSDESGIWPPKFTKLELEFQDGTKLAFTDPRRFAKLILLKDPLLNEPLSKLGFDCYLELPSKQEFAEKIAKYQNGTLKIKALLLDQSFSAGVGNWVADEVLYQARIHPEHPVAMLEPEHVDAVWESLKSVIEISVGLDADSDQFPKTWLFHYRWTNKRASSIDGKTIDFVTVGSRTSAYVPVLQKLPKGVSLQTKVKKSKKKSEDDDSNDAEEEENGTPNEQKPKRRAVTKRKAAEPSDVSSTKRVRVSKTKKAQQSDSDEPADLILEEDQKQKPVVKKSGRQTNSKKATKQTKKPAQPTKSTAKRTTGDVPEVAKSSAKRQAKASANGASKASAAATVPQKSAATGAQGGGAAKAATKWVARAKAPAAAGVRKKPSRK